MLSRCDIVALSAAVSHLDQLLQWSEVTCLTGVAPLPITSVVFGEKFLYVLSEFTFQSAFFTLVYESKRVVNNLEVVGVVDFLFLDSGISNFLP